jgi:hypothetical protein
MIFWNSIRAGGKENSGEKNQWEKIKFHSEFDLPRYLFLVCDTIKYREELVSKIKPAALEILAKKNFPKKSAWACAEKTIRHRSQSVCRQLHWFSGDFFGEFSPKFLLPRFFGSFF